MALKATTLKFDHSRKRVCPVQQELDQIEREKLLINEGLTPKDIDLWQQQWDNPIKLPK